MFFNYPPVHDNADSGDMYADYVNHCRRWREMNVPDSKVSTAHECTHGINAELRNSGEVKLSQRYGYGISLVTDLVGEEGDTDPDGLKLWQPVKPPEKMSSSFLSYSAVNAFYVGQNRAIKLPEPRIRKSAAAKVVPSNLREYRYKLYMAGQRAWDDTPLYVWDEWVAYANGADCCLDLVRRDNYTGGNTDFLLGVLEFNVYATAVLMATEAVNPGWLKENTSVAEFFKWHWDRCWRLYFEGEPKFQWDSQKRYVEACLTSQQAEPVREFLQANLQAKFPESEADLTDNDKVDHMLI